MATDYVLATTHKLNDGREATSYFMRQTIFQEFTSRLDEAMKFATPGGARLAIKRYGLDRVRPLKVRS